MFKILHVLGLVLLSAGLVLGGLYLADLRRSQAVTQMLRSQVTPQVSENTTAAQPAIQPVTQPAASPEPTVMPTPSPRPTMAIKANPLSELFRQNTDLVGWLKIADTRIDYPVVKGRDNEFYLDHGFDRQKNRAGAIFMDYRNLGDGSDPHTIIYGHKMKNKSMFYDLLLFRDNKFYAANRTLTLQTLYGPKQYRVFAAYTTSTDFYFIRTRFDEDSFATFIAEIQQRSDHAWDTPVGFQDRLLTLVTCSHDFQDSRYVVHAILIDD